VEDSFYKLVDCYDLTSAASRAPNPAWFIEPAGNTRKLPCVVRYIGYSAAVAAFEHLDGLRTATPRW